VVITNQLDPTHMELSTLSLGLIAFGDKQIIPPPGPNPFAADVDLRPAKNLIVSITTNLNSTTGILT
jgi:hypothetical protein